MNPDSCKSIRGSRKPRSLGRGGSHSTTKPLVDIEDAPRRDGDKARSKAAQLKATGQSRLEDISVFRIEKIVRKGRGKDRFNGYWYAAWVKSGRSRNVYLGNCDKISMEEALEKARRIKAADLKLEEVTA